MTGHPSRRHADFPPHPASAAEARHHVRATLTAWHLQALIDTTELIVSELVTNAIRAADGSPHPVRLGLALQPPHLLIEVSDPDPTPPAPRTPALTDEGGRGLLLVAALAAAWGHHATTTGKTIWCTLPTPASQDKTDGPPEKAEAPPPARRLKSPGISAHEGTPRDMADLFPPIEPYDSGMLDVGDGNLVHWETSGNPCGKPSLVVHGGPGSGSSPGSRRFYDPDLYRIVQFDQRGCGRSTPNASDPAADMSVNTTEHLIADMERLREHLCIERWQLFGGSWGSTLILAYAERHPGRVTEIVIPSVTTTRRAETEWLYEGVGRFFPEQWHRFREGVPVEDRDGNLIAAYSRLMEHPDPAIRAKAATDWCAWEDAVISQEPNGTPNAYSDRPTNALLAFVRICTHYFANNAWLEEGTLLREASRLKGIPGVLLHGRLDMGSPLDTAWHLTRQWPDAELKIIDDAGHTGSTTLRTHVLTTLERFATRPAN
ncbi:prolyl aminopeptidase [Sphaerisporangium aureirubrum]|uniref:Proline iminopeptidase n=1 Tax=Sphaerisporangium aureirubrum TaxID=1544736 RepID=A0ABW1N980_9ACTN